MSTAADQRAVDVELAAGGDAVPLGDVGAAGRLELVAQLDVALGHRGLGEVSQNCSRPSQL